MAGEGGGWLAGSSTVSGNINSYTKSNALLDDCGKLKCDF